MYRILLNMRSYRYECGLEISKHQQNAKWQKQDAELYVCSNSYKIKE